MTPTRTLEAQRLSGLLVLRTGPTHGPIRQTACPIDTTTFEDTARFTAEAALDPDPLPRRFNIAGETLTPLELAQAVSEASQRPLSVVRLGSLADLDGEITRRQAAEPRNFYAWVPLMYWRAMLNGKGKLGELVNARYPHIRPTTVREYVRRHGL